jgi:hypothetical protein
MAQLSLKMIKSGFVLSYYFIRYCRYFVCISFTNYGILQQYFCFSYAYY